MKRFYKTIVYLFFVMMFLTSFSIANASWAEMGDTVLKDAKELEKLEKDYFNKRLKNDLKGAYQYQHPDFKKAISIEEFMYFEGRIVSGYRNGLMGHISGGMIPPLNWIKKNFAKKDALGFPRASYYKWFINSSIVEVSPDNIFLDHCWATLHNFIIYFHTCRNNM